jgi:hypothetical protein
MTTSVGVVFVSDDENKNPRSPDGGQHQTDLGSLRRWHLDIR